jgi:uncharacterized protein
VVEQLLIARRALYDTVYYHKTVRSAEGMIGLLLKHLKDAVSEKGWLEANLRLFEPFRKVIEGKPLTPPPRFSALTTTRFGFSFSSSPT